MSPLPPSTSPSISFVELERSMCKRLCEEGKVGWRSRVRRRRGDGRLVHVSSPHHIVETYKLTGVCQGPCSKGKGRRQVNRKGVDAPRTSLLEFEHGCCSGCTRPRPAHRAQASLVQAGFRSPLCPGLRVFFSEQPSQL